MSEKKELLAIHEWREAIKGISFNWYVSWFKRFINTCIETDNIKEIEVLINKMVEKIDIMNDDLPF